jgi:hypothetical protein
MQTNTTTAINNLNKVIDQREKMIDDIIYSKHTVTTDKQYDSLYKRYNSKSYKDLIIFFWAQNN